MTENRLIVVHDVLGTCFGLESAVSQFKELFGDQIKDHDDRFAELVIMDWFHAAQRDFTYLSISGGYQPIGAVFKATLPRVLQQAGLKAPTTSGKDDTFGETVTKPMIGSLSTLKARNGLVEAFSSTYRSKASSASQSIEVWGATNGGMELAQKLLRGALGEQVEILTGTDAAQGFSKQQEQQQQQQQQQHPVIGLFSCDEIKVAKPDPRVYTEIKKRVLGNGASKDAASLWFVASHNWDLFAAKQAGFKTAWVSSEEHDPCSDIFGKPDITGKDLDDVARQILQSSGSNH